MTEGNFEVKFPIIWTHAKAEAGRGKDREEKKREEKRRGEERRGEERRNIREGRESEERRCGPAKR